MHAVVGGFLRIYWFSLLVTTAIVVLVGALLGQAAMYSIIALSALEIIFSLDNAVGNARILGNMNPHWRGIFLSVGVVVAVFGVRLLLPLGIVVATAQMQGIEALRLAIDNPQAYAAILAAAYPLIASFGGVFLLMNFLDFVFKQGGLVRRSMPRLLTIVVLVIVSLAVPAADQTGVVLSGLAGMGLYMVVDVASRRLAAASETERRTQTFVVRGGLATFLYLELLDASFSIDGVAGAFAITNNVVLIAAGLGVGAVWVRAMTIDLVKRGALSHYRYLDIVSRFAIGVLAALMLGSVAYELPSAATRSIELAIIGLSLAAILAHSRLAARTGVLIRKAVHSHRR